MNLFVMRGDPAGSVLAADLSSALAQAATKSRTNSATAWILLLSTDLALVVDLLTVSFQSARAALADGVASLRHERPEAKLSYRPGDISFDGLTTDSLIWDG